MKKLYNRFDTGNMKNGLNPHRTGELEADGIGFTTLAIGNSLMNRGASFLLSNLRGKSLVERQTF